MKKPPAIQEPLTPPTESTVITVQTLREVRENAMNHRQHLSQTISELTVLADEINITLATLKAQRGDR